MSNTDNAVSLIDNALSNNLSCEKVPYGKLYESMRYSVLAGGKRVRPRLTLEFCRLCGSSYSNALPFACAVELIHTYSLIHDDLPCMDDDSVRRGRPSNHIAYGEDIALLAGDALQSLAFEVMLSGGAVSAVGADNAAAAALCLARCCGADGMVGGQVIDLMSEGKKLDGETLGLLCSLKTSALIRAACEMGCIVAGAGSELIHAASVYGENIGLAFQIVDDILDITSSTQKLGKPVNSDIENDKSTHVALFGVDKCRSLVNELTEKACSALGVFSGDTGFFTDFAEKLASRES